MKISSNSFDGKIPSKFTCDGENINPSLSFTDVPSSKSLVLIMDDPDIPDSVKEKFGDTFDHWILFNLDPSVTSIDENSTLGVQGSNSGGEAKYTGPCPPDREHRYFFKLYALDITLDLEEGAAKKEVEAAMEGHIIEKAELMGRYERLENG